MKKIAINGFGRIGRAALRIIIEEPELQIVAINDLLEIENAVYLLKHDSVYGNYKQDVVAHGNHIHIGNQLVQYFSEKDPAQLPWKKMGIDIVIESTGRFTNKEDAEKHIFAGAKTVVISGPTKSDGIPTVIYGVNTADGKANIFSCASCTTNSVTPVMEILGRRLGIKKAILITAHAYTASQSLIDGHSNKSFRMGRAAAVNLTPASTGAAIATTKALTQYQGKFDGVAIRTPVVAGSISDITFIAARNTTVEEINKILIEESATARYQDVVTVTEEPLVSSDIIGSTYAAIIDLSITKVVDGDLVKVMIWYDNECGFANQMIRQIKSLQ